jgi:hypothetical protein
MFARRLQPRGAPPAVDHRRRQDQPDPKHDHGRQALRPRRRVEPRRIARRHGGSRSIAERQQAKRSSWRR